VRRPDRQRSRIVWHRRNGRDLMSHPVGDCRSARRQRRRHNRWWWRIDDRSDRLLRQEHAMPGSLLLRLFHRPGVLLCAFSFEEYLGLTLLFPESCYFFFEGEDVVDVVETVQYAVFAEWVELEGEVLSARVLHDLVLKIDC